MSDLEILLRWCIGIGIVATLAGGVEWLIDRYRWLKWFNWN